MKLFIPYNDLDTPTPLFEPECAKCRYVGVMWQKDSKSDVYVCNDTVIIKHSNNAGDYTSGSVRDYMHILIQASDYTSDLRWIIFQLYDKGILKLRPKFLFNLPVKKLSTRYGFNNMQIGDSEDYYIDLPKVKAAYVSYNYKHKTGPKKLQLRTTEEGVTLTMIANN